ncbi:hypothetical protein jhhlp_002398 [Lomentospora prolificans]|uniref:Heterokaryon incompatibility domain-containing protein n=1 Tax=Lomentospora prolificans TaxID=41688 RepID=A0A2N3NDZ9_9PEZI|nr:hypothetical protein jhhlp_002398 [Lomentospora prolificans]
MSTLVEPAKQLGVFGAALAESPELVPFKIPADLGQVPGWSLGKRSSFTVESLHVPEYIHDLSFVRPWMKECSSNHPYCCEKAIPVNDRPVGDIFLIDLQDENRIVKGPLGASYITLSYVWSENPQQPELPIQVGERIPTERMSQLFLDVSHVAEELGFRYLWIDRYCIAQHDNKLKHRQIQQMRIIYRNGELCIVALDDDAEEAGLPGISRPRLACCLKKKGSSPRRRSSSSAEPETYLWRLRHLSRGSVTPMSASRSRVQNLIRASKWWRRAWTYQEHCLSRRCLVFTDEQLYFECDMGMCRCETDTATTEEVQGIFQIMRPFPRSKIRVDNVFRAYREHLQEYSKKELRHESQALNALVGIVKHYQMIHPLLHQVSGIPFFTSNRRRGSAVRGWWSEEDEAHMSQAVLPFSLAWVHRYMGWCEKDIRPRPREMFPKWSPLGWTGEMTYDWEGGANFYDFQPLSKDFAFKLNGRMIPCEELYSSAEYGSLSQFQQDLFNPRILSMNTVSLPSSAIGEFMYNNDSFSNTVCGFSTRVSFSYPIKSPKRVNKMLMMGELQALALGDNSVSMNGSLPRALFVIVGQPSFDAESATYVYTRMGVLSVECHLSEIGEYFAERRVDFFKWQTFAIQ